VAEPEGAGVAAYARIGVESSMPEFRNVRPKVRGQIHRLLYMFAPNSSVWQQNTDQENFCFAWNSRYTRIYLRARLTTNVAKLVAIRSKLERLGYATRVSTRNFAVDSNPLTIQQHQVLEAVYTAETGYNTSNIPNMDAAAGNGRGGVRRL